VIDTSSKKDTLKTALALEKKVVTTYKQLESEAKKRNALDLAKFYDDYGKEAEKRVEKIEELQRKIDKEKRELED
jgi:ferritin